MLKVYNFNTGCCLTPVVNFREVRRAYFAKSTLLTSTLVPLESFKARVRKSGTLCHCSVT